MAKKNAIILCSGGLDSVTTAHYVNTLKEYSNKTVLFFNYGQKSLTSERKYSKQCAKDIKAEFKEIKTALGNFSTSIINKNRTAVNKRNLKNTKKESEQWYVPGRNTVFLSYAMALADSIKISKGKDTDIFVGFKSEGEENYPDTTPEFINKMTELSEDAFSSRFEIIAPFHDMDKEDIVEYGSKINLDFKKTHSCYSNNKHCGECLACRLRKSGFYWSGKDDPTQYIK